MRYGCFCGRDVCISANVDVHAGRKHDEVEYADQHSLLIAAHDSAQVYHINRTQLASMTSQKHQQHNSIRTKQAWTVSMLGGQTSVKVRCLGSPVYYLASHEIDTERCGLLFSFLFLQMGMSAQGGYLVVGCRTDPG